jgi:hypothetical protein
MICIIALICLQSYTFIFDKPSQANIFAYVAFIYALYFVCLLINSYQFASGYDRQDKRYHIAARAMACVEWQLAESSCDGIDAYRPYG